VIYTLFLVYDLLIIFQSVLLVGLFLCFVLFFFGYGIHGINNIFYSSNL
jgi:hypothetical protein